MAKVISDELNLLPLVRLALACSNDQYPSLLDAHERAKLARSSRHELERLCYEASSKIRGLKAQVRKID